MTVETATNEAPGGNGRLLPWLYGLTLFVSAGLLFWVEPMVAKLLLPWLGGAPNVWNTCLVFFQAALLAGYAYAHLCHVFLRPRTQLALHVLLLLLAAWCVPFGVPEDAAASLSGSSGPVGWLLGTLFRMVGPPFFVLSASGPLLQHWFSRTGHRAAGDPYFLYAASNAGSLVALLGYPVLLEPSLPLRTQGWAWAAGFLALVSLLSLCGVCAGCLRPSPPQPAQLAVSVIAVPARAVAPVSPTWRRRLYWLVLAFTPSSLLLGVTTYISTDIAAIPLMWVIPLALYLVTFVLAFAQRQLIPSAWVSRALPVGALALTFLLVSRATEPVSLLLSLHLVVFFIAALFCHGRLAADRPPVTHLTEFYLWVSVGGVLGGFFNALLAPALFSSVVEYPLVLVLVCLLRTRVFGRAAGRPRLGPAACWVLGMGLLTATLAWWTQRWTDWPPQARTALAFGLPLVVCYFLVERPPRFALALGAVLLVAQEHPDQHGRTLYRERNFFGVSRVTLDPSGNFHRLVHGNTIHGRQFLDPTRQTEPLSYYHRAGPAGRVLKQFEVNAAADQVGIVGLGAGALLCYAKPSETWTVYEIDPTVARIASNTNYFTYVHNCPARELCLVLGDARLRLREAPPHGYGLLVLDAFSSDAIPLHLVTQEALDLYLAKLAPRGLLAFHISNRCLNLEPVLGDLAAAAGLVCRAMEDEAYALTEQEAGKEASHWLVMARQPADLSRLRRDARWHPVSGRRQTRVWTDDFSNLLTAFKW